MEKVLNCDLCIIGGGVSGIGAAVTAARLGVKVVLVQDRNVLGGNASSEVRMWIRGAGLRFPDYTESGLVEELALDNMHYNPQMNYHLWDGVLYNKVKAEKNITLLLGSTCIGAKQEGDTIKEIEVWEMQSYTKYKIQATYFADCSGDCILAEFTSAEHTQGRENASEYGEECATSTGDTNTMGNSCMLQMHKTDAELSHTPFPFEREDIDELCDKRVNLKNHDFRIENFWWLELGGHKNALKDAREINEELLSTNFAIHSKIMRENKGWALDWIGFLGAKRETRRYKGDYVLTATDIQNAQKFDDEIAYGGWPMDDHDPKGLYANVANRNIYPETPYPIPYRCLYSKNIKNLFFAGRNISATHMAISSTRVMATCMSLGQAVGVACSVAKKYGVTPREVGAHIDEVQQILLDNDCYLLNTQRRTTIKGYGKERNIAGADERKTFAIGERVVYEFPKTKAKGVRIVFDSDLQRKFIEERLPENHFRFTLQKYPMLAYGGLEETLLPTPPSLVKDFTLEIKKDGVWQTVETEENFQRLFIKDIDAEIEGVAFTGKTTHGADEIRLFSIDLVK